MTVQKMSTEDGVYSFFFLVLLLVCMVGCMILGASYTRDVQQLFDTTEHERLGKAVELTMVFGSMILGDVIAIACICFFTRRYVSMETFGRWQRSYDAGQDKMPFYLRALTGYLLHLMRPRGP